MSMEISQTNSAQTAQMSQPVSGASGSWTAPPQQKMSDLFSKIDTAQSGTISQSQFSQAFDSLKPPAAFQAAGKTAVWSALDPNGSGQVSKSDFVSTMKSLMVQLRNPTDGTATPSSSTPAQTATDGTSAVNSFYI
jgi:Ca2+-binding EF-hand superfamily protein